METETTWIINIAFCSAYCVNNIFKNIVIQYSMTMLIIVLQYKQIVIISFLLLCENMMYQFLIDSYDTRDSRK